MAEKHPDVKFEYSFSDGKYWSPYDHCRVWKNGTYDLNASGVILKDGIQEKVYQRILIRNKKPQKP